VHASGPSVAVIGLGNVLLGDDAIGPLVILHLQSRFEFGPEVQVHDLGTPGLNLQPFLHGVTTLIVIDAIRSRQPPGTVMVLDREAFLAHPPPPRVSPHDPGLQEAIHLAELAGGRPLSLHFVGVSVAHTEAEQPMSAPVEAAVEPAMAEVRRALSDLGVCCRERADAVDVRPWWRR
jgi:hydrogenase maturation protease